MEKYSGIDSEELKVRIARLKKADEMSPVEKDVEEIQKVLVKNEEERKKARESKGERGMPNNAAFFMRIREKAREIAKYCDEVIPMAMD